MLKIRFDDISADGWNKQFSRFADQNILQTWEFGEAKVENSSWSTERVYFERDSTILGMAQVMIRRIPFLSRGLVWINRGPLWRIEGADQSDLGEMLSLLHAHYADDLGHYVLVAPTVHEPSDFIPIFANSGFKDSQTSGWASAVLDLSQSIEYLRKGLNQKWRNCLNKAERADCEVKIASDGVVFDDFLKGHAEFHSAKELTTNIDVDFIDRLRKYSADNCNLVALVAYHEGLPIGAVLIASYGGSSEYLAGNSNDIGRRLNSGQLLLWRAIESMKQKGQAYFDLGGMDQELTPEGIFRFKKGLGAKPYRLVSEIESSKTGIVSGLLRRRIKYVRSKCSNL
jgi:hypothetical protein